MKKIKVSIIGGSGYTGSELIRLLVSHPNVEIDQVSSRKDEGKKVSDVHSFLIDKLDIYFLHPDKLSFENSDLVFFATPNGVAMNYVPNLLKQNKRVIDLSADFRLKDKSLWEKWYNQPHQCPELINESVYGLTELNRHNIKNAKLVANPGCYPTAIQLALNPLITNNIIKNDSIVIDAKSGISGAGKNNNLNLLLSESYDNFNAYSVSGHRHEPEIEENLKFFTNQKDIQALFVPHLLPTVRGIYATIYSDIKKDVSLEEVNAVFLSEYESSFFVKFLGNNKVPKIKDVRGSNQCRISLVRREERLIIFSVIDNLVKGAAGQAIQNMNVMYELNEQTGLASTPMYP